MINAPKFPEYAAAMKLAPSRLGTLELREPALWRSLSDGQRAVDLGDGLPRSSTSLAASSLNSVGNDLGCFVNEHLCANDVATQVDVRSH